jgi:phage terminase large subunit
MALRSNGYDPDTPYIPDHKYQSPYKVDFKAMDYASVRQQRQHVLRKLRTDGGWDKLKRYYADGNVCAFIEDWLYTFDPRLASKKLPSTIPLILFPRQIEYVETLMDAYYNQQDVLVGKSRDMGVSVVTLAVMTYLWLFDPGFKGSVGSRKEDLVDKIGDTDSLLEKVRIYLRYLPPELLPYGYTERDCARRMNIVNPVTGAAIKGEGGRKMGRGGRSTMYLVDEAAFLEDPESVDAAISENTQCRVDISTPNGPANPFAMKWFYNESVKAFSFHWTQDPRKDQQWYEAKKKSLQDPRIVAQELDLDFDTSGEESVVRREWIDSSIALRRWLSDQGKLPDRKEYSPVAGADVGGGVAENTYIAVWGPIVGNLVAWVDGDTTQTALKLSRLAQQDGASRLKYDSIGVGRGVASTLKGLPVVSTGINVGNKATTTMWPDGRMAKDKFINIKSETWWTLRDRLQKTHFMWQWMNDPETGCEYDLDELLLLPDGDQKFLDQIAAPGYKVLEGGKIKIETKDELARRGISSPDRAEALIIALAPIRRPATFARAEGL